MIAVLLADCSATSPTVPTGMSTPTEVAQVSGRVVDVITSAGIAGETLEWYQSGQFPSGFNVEFAARIVAESTGTYRVSLPRTGMYVVSIGASFPAGFTCLPVRLDRFGHRTHGLSDDVWVCVRRVTSRPVSGANCPGGYGCYQHG